MADRYTKTMLTIIAAALTALALRPLSQPALAQIEPQKVQICDQLGHCLGLDPRPIGGAVEWVLPISNGR